MSTTGTKKTQELTPSAAEKRGTNKNEAGHYVVTAHHPGGVLLSVRCSFLGPDSLDVVIAKSRRLEVRQIAASCSRAPSTHRDGSDGTLSFPLVLSLPINGRLTNLLSFRHPSSLTEYLFFVTDRNRYAIISYSPPAADSAENRGSLYPVTTHASGSISSTTSHTTSSSRESECGPLVTIEPSGKCIALHTHDGFITIFPLNPNYLPTDAPRKRAVLAGTPFHARIAERTLLSMSFLLSNHSSPVTDKKQALPATHFLPQLAILHQDSRGMQHVIAHSVDVHGKCLILHSDASPRAAGSPPPPMNQRLKKTRVDGGSGVLIAVPPPGWEPPLKRDEDDRKIPARNKLAENTAATTVFGGVIILGQKQITYHSTAEACTKILPMAHCLLLSHAHVRPLYNIVGPTGSKNEDSTVRFLVGDEMGSLHLLVLQRNTSTTGPTNLVSGLHLDTLGTTSIASTLLYLDLGMVFVGSQFGDSQLVSILDEPVHSSNNNNDKEEEEDALIDGRNLSYIHVVEQYTNLGPIVDFDLIPTTHSSSEHGNKQSMVVTASGTGKDGTLRLVRNGIGMSEYASVELGGIKGMWNVRRFFQDFDDLFLIQSFVGETRILGVSSSSSEENDNNNSDDEDSMDESQVDSARGGLEEVHLRGFDSARSTLFAGNVAIPMGGGGHESLVVQVTELEVRIVDMVSMECVSAWSPSSVLNVETDYDEDEGHSVSSMITVASANGSGQAVVALRGGVLLYLAIVVDSGNVRIEVVGRTQLGREVSCIDLNAFDPLDFMDGSNVALMDIDKDATLELDRTAVAGIRRRSVAVSQLVAVGLWDDFTVRLLSLDLASPLQELLRINLGAEDEEEENEREIRSNVEGKKGRSRIRQHMMARSLCLVTLDSSSSTSSAPSGILSGATPSSSSVVTSTTNKMNMLLVGLGDGGLVSFAVCSEPTSSNSWSVHTRKEVSLGTRGVNLVPFRNDAAGGGTCVLATGDRPTVIYLTGGGSNANPKLCYSNVNLSTEGGEGLGGQQHGGRESLSVNVATPFHSSSLFSTSSTCALSSSKNYSLCVSDESTLRLGVIDDIQKLHVTTYKLGMAPRRVAHHEAGRALCVGCIDDESTGRVGGEANMGNCIRFIDDTTFEELDRLDLDPYEMILSMLSTRLRVGDDLSSLEAKSDENNDRQRDAYQPYLLVGTAYAYPDEDEPTKGRILVVQCSGDGVDGNRSASGGTDTSGRGSSLSRSARQITELQTKGGVYSICAFYGGSVLITINSKTHMCQLTDSGAGMGSFPELKLIGGGHHGHILSLFVKSLLPPDADKIGSDKRTSDQWPQLAIVGDLMRSISVVQYYPEFQTIEELARDYNSNWTTAIEMLTDDVYLGAENWNNLFVLRRNADATSEEVRCRLDTVGEFHLGEMVNKFMSGSLVMPSTSSGSGAAGTGGRDSTVPSAADGQGLSSKRVRKPAVTTGSQTLFATVDGTIGSVIGLDAATATFFSALELSMSRLIVPVGDLKHNHFRAFDAERRHHPSSGFVDGDLVESFLDLDRTTMENIVMDMNKNGGLWKSTTDAVGSRREDEDEDVHNNSKLMASGTQRLTVNEVLEMVEEISMMH